MEEGPEPHEWIEKTVEQQHHEHGSGEKGPAVIVPAVTAAVLAVCAAFGSLLSGHAANQAILFQTQATDQWAYFQAKSTKGHIYEVGKEVVRTLAEAQGGPTAGVRTGLDRFQQQVDRYDREKEEIKEKAEHLEAESRLEFRKHHFFALGVASFQVGIVLASVSMLVRVRSLSRALFALSLLAGVVGIGLLVSGLSIGPGGLSVAL
jgi:hypothetical protein